MVVVDAIVVITFYNYNLAQLKSMIVLSITDYDQSTEQTSTLKLIYQTICNLCKSSSFANLQEREKAT